MRVAVLRRGRRWRWVVVGAVVAVLVSLPGLVTLLPVSTSSDSPERLYEKILASTPVPYQGFALAGGTAGLPSLPQLADVVTLLTSQTQLRVWYQDPRRWRIDQIGVGTERDIYQLADRQVLWDFGADQLTQIVGDQQFRLPRGADLVPPDLARRLLGTAGPGAGTLTALPAQRVAGHPGAGLRVTPTDPHTTVGHIDVWADPDTGLPLQVELTPRGASSPVLVTRFLDLALTTPDPATLVPPDQQPGMNASVTTGSDIADAFRSLRLGPLPAALAGAPRIDNSSRAVGVGVYGTGFSQYLVLPVPRRIGFDAMDRAGRAGGLRVAFPEGEGVLLASPLLSVLVMDSDPARRTYILVGLVDGTVLRAAGTELSTFTQGVRQ